MTNIAKLAPVPVLGPELQLSPEEIGREKTLRSEIAAARTAGFRDQLSSAEHELWKLTTQVWHRENPDAFTWLAWEDYRALTDWTHLDDYNVETGKCSARLPTDILKNVSGWNQYFNRIEHHSEHGVHVIVGDFEDKRALLATWSDAGRELISYETMREVDKLRRLFRKTDARYQGVPWGFWGFLIGAAAVIAFSAWMIGSSYVPNRHGPIVTIVALVVAVIGAFLGARFARYMRNRVRAQAKQDFPVAIDWI